VLESWLVSLMVLPNVWKGLKWYFFPLSQGGGWGRRLKAHWVRNLQIIKKKRIIKNKIKILHVCASRQKLTFLRCWNDLLMGQFFFFFWWVTDPVQVKDNFFLMNKEANYNLLMGQCIQTIWFPLHNYHSKAQNCVTRFFFKWHRHQRKKLFNPT
jgi:hypothetical protein